MEEFREDAAIKGITKLQARQRGAQDRQRVHVDKAQGNLPGQKRNVPQLHLSESHAQESPKADNVLEDLTAEDIENRKKAALKIQTIQRGRHTRKVLAENDLEAARAIFAERNMMHDLHMDADVLARSSAGQQLEENNANNMNKYALEQAKQVALQHQHEDEVAAVRMQSLYRGFRDRKQIRGKRESAELSQRHKASANVIEQAEEAKKVYDQQTSYTAGGIERSYLTSSRKEKQAPARRAAGQSSAAPKAVLAPTLVDKKACMTMLQKKACIMLEEQIRPWAISYARSVELAPGAQRTGELEFVALFSKPSKEEPIAWPVVRVYLSMQNDFESQPVPQVTYRLEGERMTFDTNTDLGRRFKEAWLDRIVMDKRAIRADMALRHKK